MGLFNKAIIVHHIDADGYCAGYWAVRSALKMGVPEERIIAVSYNYGEFEKNPEHFTIFDSVDSETVVFVVDIMLPESLMKTLYNISGHMVWIDHHGTSIAAMHDFDPELANDIPGIRIDGIAACELAWAYYHSITTKDILDGSDPKSGHITIPIQFTSGAIAWDGTSKDLWIPKGTLLVSDNDTWTHRYSESKIYAALMRRICSGRPYLNHYLFDDFFDDGVIEWELVKAEQVYHFEVEEMQELAKGAIPATLLVPLDDPTGVGEAYRCLIIKSEKYNSQMFEYCTSGLASKADIFVKAYIDADGVSHYTLYRGKTERATNIHCGLICKKFGGGGHPGAAGFTSKEPAFCVDVPGMEDI